MADLTKNTAVGAGDEAPIDAVAAQKATILSGRADLKAGEAIAVMDACYIKSDGLVYKAVSTQTTVSGISDFDGLAYKAYSAGDPVTLLGEGNIVEYTAAAGLTPGAYYYASATAGKIGDADVLGTDKPVAKAIEDNKLIVIVNGRF